jgi:hypothetical protein
MKSLKRSMALMNQYIENSRHSYTNHAKVLVTKNASKPSPDKPVSDTLIKRKIAPKHVLN